MRVEADSVMFTREFNLQQRLGGWSPYFMLDGRLWGKFAAPQLCSPARSTWGGSSLGTLKKRDRCKGR